MKDLETLQREETRESVESQFSITAPETTRAIQQSEPNSHPPFVDTLIGSESYRLSPLSEW